MTENFSSQITRHGVSESFNVFIDGLRNTPGIHDSKFRLADVNKVAQYLVCRNYGKACLELSYLLWAVVNYSPDDSANCLPLSTASSKKPVTNSPLLDFFWLNENITPARFRLAFATPYQNSSNDNDVAIFLNKAGLQITLSQQSFVISPVRVGLLAVLLEIIISIAPEKITIIEQSLSLQDQERNSEQAIKQLSSDLQKLLYQFLSEHLVPAQQQKRFRYISQWLAKKNNDDILTNTHLLTDETILFFWQEAAEDKNSPGYKLYSSAFNDVIETHQAIQQAKQALAVDNANTIGFDIEAGEYSPDVIQELLFNEEATTQAYAWLCETPKFLTKKQWQFIEPQIEKHAYRKSLPLSFARLAIFGQWQASIVQAKRKSTTILNQKLTEVPEKDYLLWQQQLTKLIKSMTQVQLAITHIFYFQRDSRYLGFLLNLLPKDIALQIKTIVNETISPANKIDKTKQSTPQISATTTAHLKSVLFTQSQPLLKESLAYNRIMVAAKSAFNNNNKDGFQHIPESELLDIYQDGYEGLTHCQRIILDYLAQLSKKWRTSQDCQQNYCSDVSIFKTMFEKLYGEINGQ